MNVGFIQTLQDLCTPLHLASKSGHQNIVETLVCHGAMTEANDHVGYTNYLIRTFCDMYHVNIKD